MSFKIFFIIIILIIVFLLALYDFVCLSYETERNIIEKYYPEKIKVGVNIKELIAKKKRKIEDKKQRIKEEEKEAIKIAQELYKEIVKPYIEENIEECYLNSSWFIDYLEIDSINISSLSKQMYSTIEKEIRNLIEKDYSKIIDDIDEVEIKENGSLLFLCFMFEDEEEE